LGAKVVSRLSEQVEAKIVRANRAFRLSSRVIAAAHLELESHGEWLDRHRATFAGELKRHRRLLKRKLALRTVMRSAVGLVFAAPFALARALGARLKFHASPQPRAPWEEPPFTRHTALQLRIRRLDERAAPIKADLSRLGPEQIGASKEISPLAEGKASPTAATNARSHAGRVSVSSVAALALLVVAAGVLRAMFSGSPSEELAVTAREIPEATPHAAAATLTVAKPATIATPAEQPDKASGFAVLETAPSIDALRTPPETIADMVVMAMAEPVASPSGAAEAAPAPTAEQPLPPKQAMKTKPKRKLAAREPEPLPWWQQWSWIRVR
jgi:hypothetical protein